MANNKPDSVFIPSGINGNHISLRHTRASSRNEESFCTYFALLQVGFAPWYHCWLSTVRFYRTFSPLPYHFTDKAVIFCGTFRKLSLPILEKLLYGTCFVSSPDFPPIETMSDYLVYHYFQRSSTLLILYYWSQNVQLYRESHNNDAANKGLKIVFVRWEPNLA